MFEFLSLLALPDCGYSERKVARYEDDGWFISTAAVPDGDCPFETAIMHPDYNDGALVIVEAYETRDEAMSGHEKWVNKMLSDLPPYLEDCANAHIAKLIGKERFYREEKTHDRHHES